MSARGGVRHPERRAVWRRALFTHLACSTALSSPRRPFHTPPYSSLSSLLPWLDSSLLSPFPTLCSSCTLHYYVLAPPLCAVLPLLQPHSAARFLSSPRPLTKGVDICLHHTPYQDRSLTNADATETFLNARHISGLTTINRYHCRPAAPSRPCCRLATL